MSAPTPGLPTREDVAAEVKRVTHAWSGPAMDEFLNDPPTRKQLAISDAVLAMVSDALAAVTAERDQAQSDNHKIAEAYRVVVQQLADAPHGWACDFNVMPGLDRVPDDAECACWKAGL